MNQTVNKRLLALDVLRGITIAGMIMVNNPGSWSYVYAPLGHAAWIGLTPTDLVFPFFMFIMGISTYISLRKYNFEFSHSAALKILKRTIVIFAIPGIHSPVKIFHSCPVCMSRSGLSATSAFWVSCSDWRFATVQQPSSL